MQRQFFNGFDIGGPTILLIFKRLAHYFFGRLFEYKRLINKFGEVILVHLCLSYIKKYVWSLKFC